jgi:hypothetical protein
VAAGYRASVLITECYSPKNLGDWELVDASVSAAAGRHKGEVLAIVALDTRGFSKLYPDTMVMGRIFDRGRFATSGGLDRFSLLLGWTWAIVVLSVCSIVAPARVRRHTCALAIRALPGHMRETLLLYIHADYMYPVGGGYLGDRYMRETLLTLWSWWWASRCGCRVATMPISIEARSLILRAALAILGRHVVFAVRDSSSVRVLASEGIRARLIPDLAFRNARIVDCRRRPDRADAIVVAPVGGDYFDEDVWKYQLGELAAALVDIAGARQIVLVAMHSSLDGPSAGHDEAAVIFIADELRRRGRRSSIERFRRYEALCSYMRDECGLVVSARMHAGIAGVCAGVPVILLGYEEKHRSLLIDLSWGENYRKFGAVCRRELGELMLSVMEMPPRLLDDTARDRVSILSEWMVDA